jgi:hypothetical protein
MATGEGGLDLVHPLVIPGEPRRRRLAEIWQWRPNPSGLTPARACEIWVEVQRERPTASTEGCGKHAYAGKVAGGEREDGAQANRRRTRVGGGGLKGLGLSERRRAEPL